MQYTREITRAHRTAFVIAIDQSSSMQESVTVGDMTMCKAEAVALVSGRLIDELIMRARRDDGVRDYYDIAVIGYSGDSVYPLVGETCGFIPVTTLASNIPEHKSIIGKRVLPSGETVTVRQRVNGWITPRSQGNTPMYEMLLLVRELVEAWCAEPRNAESFPPMVFNITDGEPTDSSDDELRYAAMRLRSIATHDGNVLLFNIHISGHAGTESILFPRADEIDADNRYARLLAEISSTAPEAMNDAVRSFRGDLASPPYLAMSYNASICEAVAMLNIGSRSITTIE